MTQIISPINQSTSSGRKIAGVRQMIKHNLKIDMTPMVDLGFLLISFFVITTELSKPTAMDIIMPTDGKPVELKDSDALTVLLDKDNTIWYYTGNWEKAVNNNAIIKTTYRAKDGLRKIINVNQKRLDRFNKQEGRNGLMLLIKPTKNTSYKNLVDVLDEVTINLVKKYVVVNPSLEEKSWLENNQ